MKHLLLILVLAAILAVVSTSVCAQPQPVEPNAPRLLQVPRPRLRAERVVLGRPQELPKSVVFTFTINAQGRSYPVTLKTLLGKKFHTSLSIEGEHNGSLELRGIISPAPQNQLLVQFEYIIVAKNEGSELSLAGECAVVVSPEKPETILKTPIIILEVRAEAEFKNLKEKLKEKEEEQEEG